MLQYSTVKAYLFPASPRSFPYRRTVCTAMRTVHIFTACTLLAGHLFAQPTEILHPWLLGALVSGFILFFIDLYTSCRYLLELSGLAVVIKLVCTALVAWFPEQAVSLLGSALVVGSVSSHMPGRLRHRRWWPAA